MTREDWEVVKLGNVVSYTTWKLDSNAMVEWGKYPYFTCSQEVFAINEYAFDQEAVLLWWNNANAIFPLKYYVWKFNAYQRTYVMATKNEEILLTHFLYYVLRPQLEHFKSISTWSTTKFLTKQILDNLDISLPPLAEQKRIASILSAYDDLIENNTRRIALLEQMTQTLYRQWFVEYKFPWYQDVEMINSGTEFGIIPSGWGMKKIGDEIAKIKRAKKIQSKEYQTNWSIPIIDQSRWHIAWYTDDEMYLQTSPLPIVVFWDHTRIVKYISFPFASGADGTQLMYPKNEKMLPNYFYLAILQTEVPNYHYERHYKFLQDKYIIIPSDYILDQFHIQTIPMFDEILSIQKQNQALKEQRDLLLRKLIG